MRTSPTLTPDYPAPPRKLLGYGQEQPVGALLDDEERLRLLETPAVHLLWGWCFLRCRATLLYRQADRLRAWVDVANARIRDDRLGGDDNGSRDPSGLPIPKLQELRADANNNARVCIRHCEAGRLGEASDLLAKVLVEICA
jgi:hypothetical protein